MSEILRMPEVSANTVEAILASWNVELNAPYSAGDAIATVETEKAIVDIEAESDGVLLRFLVPEGAHAEVGAPIAVWGSPGDTAADADALLAELPDATTPDEPAADTPTATIPSTGGRLFASPLARRIAREHGVDLSHITGSGPGGRIRRRDIAATLTTRGTVTPALTAPTTLADTPQTTSQTSLQPTPQTSLHTAPQTSQPTPPQTVTQTAPQTPQPTPLQTTQQTTLHTAPQTVTQTAPLASQRTQPLASQRTQSGAAGGVGGVGYEDVPVSRFRQVIARRLSESKQTAPHFYLRGSARVDRLLALRREINDGGTVKASVNDLVVKAVGRAHLLVPGLNVQWNGDSIRHFTGVDVAVAVATENGLVTPVVRGVDGLTLQQLVEATQDRIARAKDRRLQQSELEGGSISVTNLGMYGVEEFAAIINPPQAAILAVGAARKEAVVEDGGLVAGTVMRVTLAVDHRPVDGATAAEWMRVFVGLLEHPAQILV